MEYIVLCSRSPGNELISGECEALTGKTPNPNGLALCRSIEYIPRAAYLTTGLRYIARGETLHELEVEISKLSISVNNFRIEFSQIFEAVSIHKQGAIELIADAICGSPDLIHPLHRFMIIRDMGSFYFGEILAETERSYRKHDEKPYRTSSSLPSQLARALVNLAYPAKTIFDPCCGTGSILLEAAATGAQSFGMDRNPKMVGMSRRNLLYFDYPAQVNIGDASECNLHADAVVTDLPYGRFLAIDENNVRGILNRMVHLAPLGIYVTEVNISDWMLKAGYRQVNVYRIFKRKNMVRYIHKGYR